MTTNAFRRFFQDNTVCAEILFVLSTESNVLLFGFSIATTVSHAVAKQSVICEVFQVLVGWNKNYLRAFI